MSCTYGSGRVRFQPVFGFYTLYGLKPNAARPVGTAYNDTKKPPAIPGALTKWST
ncbi:hypothetical protein [Spirosoma aerophilum]